MWPVLRSRVRSLSSLRPWPWSLNRSLAYLTPDKDGKTEILKLEEVEKVLSDVKAGDIRVLPVGNLCDWTDYMVFATGRSSWHVRNIAEALVYKARFHKACGDDGYGFMVDARGLGANRLRRSKEELLGCYYHPLKGKKVPIGLLLTLVCFLLHIRFAAELKKEEEEEQSEKQRGILLITVFLVLLILGVPGTVVVHALDEKARAYYDLESQWVVDKPRAESSQDLDKAMVKIRRKNNSKKKVQTSA
ncbi:hypothetical protein Cgig2_018184 [Carnegiea gigantea]|uniref:Uncharacterized protein n=1 Tax=Carnegiea gigantea TaxID=171969 RepID=A0A9Q1KX79_9CARY|nr:hypothetical protein Cgig2_018184 [Carnegiea gigantea]